MAKLKLASYWAAACGGCDVAILDIHEKILDLAAAADIVFWPIATDFKYSDVEAMPDGHIDVTLFHGAVRNSENEHLAHLLRAKSKAACGIRILRPHRRNPGTGEPVYARGKSSNAFTTKRRPP